MILALAITTVISLGALLLSFLAVFQARLLLQASHRRNAAPQPPQDTHLEAIQASIQDLTAEMRELQTQPAGSPSAFRPALNLSKRSQALRMHRRGETAEQIAAALDIPPQEVELLIKVHRIVLSNM